MKFTKDDFKSYSNLTYKYYWLDKYPEAKKFADEQIPYIVKLKNGKYAAEPHYCDEYSQGVPQQHGGQITAYVWCNTKEHSRIYFDVSEIESVAIYKTVEEFGTNNDDKRTSPIKDLKEFLKKRGLPPFIESEKKMNGKSQEKLDDLIAAAKAVYDDDVVADPNYVEFRLDLKDMMEFCEKLKYNGGVK